MFIYRVLCTSLILRGDAANFLEVSFVCVKWYSAQERDEGSQENQRSRLSQALSVNRTKFSREFP